jgi:multimeric flavodoxin WrbA
MSALILLGSARSDGNTAAAAAAWRLREALGDEAELVDLLHHRVQPYSYTAYREADDFPMLVERMLAHQQLVFATPVYWYAMSGGMKTVFDRLTDVTRGAARDKGRALKGRSAWLIAVGTDPELPLGFAEPFSRTAAYLGMSWGGAAYMRTGRAVTDPEREWGEVDRLAQQLRSTS